MPLKSMSQNQDGFIELRWTELNIKINKLNWNVKAVPMGCDNLKMESGADCFGIIKYTDLSIYLGITASADLFRQTTIHELVHAFAFSFGVHLFADENTEEPICDFVGSHLDDIHAITNRIMEGVYKPCLKQKKS